MKKVNYIEQIKRQLTIEDLLNRFGLEINSGGFVHSIYKEEKNPSLKIYPDTNSYYDFSTNKGGDVIDFYTDYLGIEKRQAIEELKEMIGLELPNNATQKLQKRQTTSKDTLIAPLIKDAFGKVYAEEQYFFDERAGIYEYDGELPREEAERCALQDLEFYRAELRSEILFKFFQFGKETMPNEVTEYLKNERKLKNETIERFSLFGIKPQLAKEFLKDNFSEYRLRISGLFKENGYFIFSKHTVIIPYIENAKIAFMKARSLTEKMKYIGLSGVSAKRFYNYDVIRESSEILIVEGEFDCLISIQELGNPTVAVGGVGNIPDLTLLKNKEVYILFDNDEAGETASKKLFDEMKSYRIKTHLLKFDKVKDLSESL